MGYTKEQREAKKASKVDAAVQQLTEPRINISAEERAAQIREARQGFNPQKTFELVADRPGWKRRWVNDINVPYRLDQGYTFVSKSQVRDTISVGFGGTDVADRITKPNKMSNPDGSAGMTTLMEIPQVIADEIQKVMVDDPTDKVEAALRGGQIGPGGTNHAHTYVPEATPIRMGYKP